MKRAKADREYNSELLRAELIHHIERGDTTAKRLLAGLTNHRHVPVWQVIEYHRRAAGPVLLERVLFFLGMLSLGLAFGILVLTAIDLVAPELESLALSVGAFLLANASLSQYGKHAEARYYATEFSQMLANVSRGPERYAA